MLEQQMLPSVLLIINSMGSIAILQLLINLLTYFYKCQKAFVGKTDNWFSYCWNNYKDNNIKFSREETCVKQHLHEHFSSGDHCSELANVSITFMNKAKQNIQSYKMLLSSKTNP